MPMCKKLVSRGAKKSVLPGGRGFECPPNLGIFFDTAEEALTHAAVGRVFDDKGRTPCLWAGCNRTFSSTQVRHGMWINGNALRSLLKHEKEHIKGDAAATTGFKCPEAGCAFSDQTAGLVWAHAAEAHGIEHVYNIQFEGSKPATNSRGIALPFTRSGSSTHAMLRPSPSPRLGWT